MTTPETWFITDRAIEDPSQDAFGHVDVAGQLAEILRTVEAPATLGLLGGFGTGKSSIGNLLAERLSSDQTQTVVTLSVERHTGTARQRALLYSFAEALVDDARVKQDKVDKVLGRIEHATDTDIPELSYLPLTAFLADNRRVLLRALWWAACLVAVLYVIGIVVAGIANWLWDARTEPWSFPATTAYIALPVVGFTATALTLAFAPWLREGLTPGRHTKRRPRAEAPDELERVFSELVALTSKRLVIVVDDIDRLDPEGVLEALTTIKSFQVAPKSNPPAFIVTCDEAIVRRAIARANPGLSPVDGSPRTAADEFLNKFFTVRQVLPPQLPEDMRQFAEDAVAQRTGHVASRVLGDDLSDVLDILVHDGVTTPRHAIRLLNAFFADLRLASVREAAGRLGQAEASGHPRTLARLAVLRVDFGDVYERIQQEFSLLLALDAFSVGRELEDAQSRTMSENFPGPADGAGGDIVVLPHGLADFLRRTAPYAGRDLDLAPFFYLMQTPAGRVLGSVRATEIRRALENNDTDAVVASFADEAELASAALDHVLVSLRSARPGLPRRNAILTASLALDAAPERQDEIGNLLAQMVAREPDLAPTPTGIRSIVRAADAVHREHLVRLLVDFESDDPEDVTPRARIVAELALESPTDQILVRGLEDYFDWLPENAGWSAVESWITMLETADRASRWRVFGGHFFVAIFDMAIGASAKAVSLEQADRIASLLQESPEAVRGSQHVLLAVLAGLSAEGESPRLLSARVLPSCKLSEETLGRFCDAASKLVTDDQKVYAETVSDVCAAIAHWATEWAALMRSFDSATSDELVSAVNQAVATTGPDGFLTEPRAAAAVAVAKLYPSGSPSIAAALVAALDGHQDVQDETGVPLRDAAVLLVEIVPSDAMETLAEGLFGPLNETPDDSDPAVQFALESIAPVARSEAGVQLIAGLAARWRANFNRGIPSLQAIQPHISALAQASTVGAVPEAEEQALLERLTAIANQGDPYPQIVCLTAASIVWRSKRRPSAAALIPAGWASLTDGQRATVINNLTRWGGTDGALGEELSQIVVGHWLVAGDDEAEALLPLWAGLFATDRGRLFAQAESEVVRSGHIRDQLTSDDLLTALTTSTNSTELGRVVTAALDCDEQVRSVAANEFVRRSFDETDLSWNEDSIDLVVGLLPAPELESLARRTLESVVQGVANVTWNVELLMSIRKADGGVLNAMRDELSEAVLERLPTSTPEVARLLGRLVAGEPRARFDASLKSMRAKGSSQREREAADAFEVGWSDN